MTTKTGISLPYPSDISLPYPSDGVQAANYNPDLVTYTFKHKADPQCCSFISSVNSPYDKSTINFNIFLCTEYPTWIFYTSSHSLLTYHYRHITDIESLIKDPIFGNFWKEVQSTIALYELIKPYGYPKQHHEQLIYPAKIGYPSKIKNPIFLGKPIMMPLHHKKEDRAKLLKKSFPLAYPSKHTNNCCKWLGDISYRGTVFGYFRCDHSDFDQSIQLIYPGGQLPEACSEMNAEEALRAVGDIEDQEAKEYWMMVYNLLLNKKEKPVLLNVNTWLKENNKRKLKFK